MKISDALANVSRLFLDTAPVIYFVERNPQFVDLVDPIFERLSTDITAVASGITLSECLVGAIRLGLADLEQAFVDVLQQEQVVFVEINAAIAREAARIRVRYNLQLPDALQVAAAIIAGCEAFLTNDAALKRVKELRVLVVYEESAQFAIRFFAHSQLKPQDKSGGLNPALFKIYLSINKFRGLYHQGIIGQPEKIPL
ncbi:type II toxin-antitoxin system VapC family toxin [Nostoc sphaeroides]|uniref:Ribonuclease VapC n=2 Tax=Nostoc TaxID=1177 RepID=A0A5P8VR32_9NOSO|nr:type II toxin-antitoxin system VapC family toxin [Nostoc sphaeroides]QFS42810.1 type II toxin-antitoxin system VapC family toxin [Nostoc sphaeroides CCNUC1]